MGRDDIVVYSLEPNKYKCDFIQYMVNINNLYNVRVMNIGLSNHEDSGKTFEIDPEFYERTGSDKYNSGWNVWNRTDKTE
eukprot:Pgem_evm1s13063